MSNETEYDKDFALRVAGLSGSKGGRITPEMSVYHTTQDVAYPVVYRFRSTIDADDYMRKHVAALEKMGDTIFREVQADIPAPVAIHDETCCMIMVNGNPKFANPHPECMGVQIVAGQQKLDIDSMVNDSLKTAVSKNDATGEVDG